MQAFKNQWTLLSGTTGRNSVCGTDSTKQKAHAMHLLNYLTTSCVWLAVVKPGENEGLPSMSRTLMVTLVCPAIVSSNTLPHVVTLTSHCITTVPLGLRTHTKITPASESTTPWDVCMRDTASAFPFLPVVIKVFYFEKR